MKNNNTLTISTASTIFCKRLKDNSGALELKKSPKLPQRQKISILLSSFSRTPSSTYFSIIFHFYCRSISRCLCKAVTKRFFSHTSKNNCGLEIVPTSYLHFTYTPLLYIRLYYLKFSTKQIHYNNIQCVEKKVCSNKIIFVSISYIILLDSSSTVLHILTLV